MITIIINITLKNIMEISKHNYNCTEIHVPFILK